MDNIEKNIDTIDDMLVGSDSLPDNTLDTHQDSEKPFVGQTFDNLEDVKQFYLSYGGRVGFSIGSFSYH